MVTMKFSLAETSEERQAAQRLFEATGHEPSRIAVPDPEFDHVFRTVLVQVHDDAGTLVAAAMTGEPYLTANLGMMPAQMRPATLVKVAAKASEIDLVSVLPEHRGQGIGTAMIQFLEPILRERGVRTWFGHALGDVDHVAVGRFWAHNGFTVPAPGEALPPFHGHTWEQTLTAGAPVAFWKSLA